VVFVKIEILGMGCLKCKTLLNTVNEVVSELNIQAEITKVEDIKQIMQYGVMLTPALVVDGVVKISGKLPSKDEVRAILKM
jgi:small redox-active disulfide protein 2